MRTGNINVQDLLAQAQARLSGSTQQPASNKGSSDLEKISDISPVLAKVHQRIAAQSQTASASLSALGQFKSDLFTLGAAAKDLASLSATSTPQAVQSSLEKLVATYNANLKSSNAMASAGSDGSTGIARAQRELGAAVDARGAPSADLRKMGVVRAPDGSLSLDTSVLAKALASHPGEVVSALNDLGKSVSGITSRTLADDSRLSTSLTRLGHQALALKEQQAAVLSTATELAALNTTGANSWSAMALAAYRRV